MTKLYPIQNKKRIGGHGQNRFCYVNLSYLTGYSTKLDEIKKIQPTTQKIKSH